jgi:hypothetical protein
MGKEFFLIIRGENPLSFQSVAILLLLSLVDACGFAAVLVDLSGAMDDQKLRVGTVNAKRVCKKGHGGGNPLFPGAESKLARFIRARHSQGLSYTSSRWLFYFRGEV